MCIVGLDVGESFVVVCPLTEFPSNILKYYEEHRKEFLKLEPDKEGAQKLLDMKPTAIILEPTGFWYSNFWYQLAKANNIEVCWVGHCDLDSKRSSFGFKDKDDYVDALCLAALYFDQAFLDKEGNKRFLKYYLVEEIHEVRDLFLKVEQLDKVRNAMVNQLRQRLSGEFPEGASYTISRQGKYDYSPSLRWFARLGKHPQLEKLWNNSQSKKLGLGLSQYTIDHAVAVVELEKRLTQTEQLLEAALEKECFDSYIKVFDLFGFGLSLKPLLLLHTYPFERFLIDGKPERVKRDSKTTVDKTVTCHRSLRKFQAFLGLAHKKRQSGKSIKTKSKKFQGSSLVRSHLYIFVTRRIIPHSVSKKGVSRRFRSPIADKLFDSYVDMRGRGIAGKDGITRLLFTLTRFLFNELLKELRD